LLKRGKLQAFEAMLEEIVAMALSSGIRFGAIQIIDSVPNLADVNTDKDWNRQKKGKEPHVPDVRWWV
jgi:hypothetical protein